MLEYINIRYIQYLYIYIYIFIYLFATPISGYLQQLHELTVASWVSGVFAGSALVATKETKNEVASSKTNVVDCNFLLCGSNNPIEGWNPAIPFILKGFFLDFRSNNFYR